MPTQSTTYNSRVTDESLEKRFRDTFRSQGGAELVDDLYAQGVIVPVVDFTAAATGQQLAQNLQTAWDFSTGNNTEEGSSSVIITNSGFWLITLATDGTGFGSGTQRFGTISMSDGISSKNIIRHPILPEATQNFAAQSYKDTFVLFVRSGDSVTHAATGGVISNASYRQIATVTGDLVDPTGFTSS